MEAGSLSRLGDSSSSTELEGHNFSASSAANASTVPSSPEKKLGHFSQADAPAIEYSPSLHWMGSVVPRVGHADPSGHVVQTEGELAPIALLKKVGWQGSIIPFLEKKPAGAIA